MEVLYEDNHLIIVNKMPGEIVQSDKTGDATLADEVKAYLKTKYDKPGDVFLGIVHRLDRPTSGALIFARTSKALARLNAMLQEKSIQKTYWAVVNERPPVEQGRLENYLKKNEEQNKSYVFDNPVKGGKLAILSYKLLAASRKFNLLEVSLETGRHHQIRAQLAKINCSIRGDLKYGAPRSNPDGSISLHARKVSFVHPVSNKPIVVVADPPKNDNLWNEFLHAIK